MAKIKMIRLGYEVGPGTPIDIPLKHLAVTGQTQAAGKTTALEALVSRADVKALAFVTKRGEGAFSHGHRTTPYFRDRADWQFVTSVIDATLQEKNKFLRPWIMKICRTTKKLADVHKAVKDALKTAKGINEGVYTQLDAYLELIVPDIGKVPLTNGLLLLPGLNVMDVTAYDAPMQMLFIQSAIDWINKNAENVVTIIPEAWETIPEGKGSPVKQSAVELVRKGAGLGNFVWVDSQDMAGVDKVILRGCTVWLIGAQREANEIKRNLNNIPAGIKKPKPADIAHLTIGQFYACWSDRTVKVYVQPAWMAAETARMVAKGDMQLSTAIAFNPPPPATKEEPMSAVVEAKIDETNIKLGELIDLLSKNATMPPSPAVTPTITERVAAVESDDRDVTGTQPWRNAEVFPSTEGDEEALYQRFKARLYRELPFGGSPMVVTPPEKLRKDFQHEEVKRLLADVAALDPLAKRILKLIESLEGGYLSQKQIAERLGRSAGGGSWVAMTTQVKALASQGFVKIDGKRGVTCSLRDKITSDLEAYQPADGDATAVYQTILCRLATEGGAKD